MITIYVCASVCSYLGDAHSAAPIATRSRMFRKAVITRCASVAVARSREEAGSIAPKWAAACREPEHLGGSARDG